MASSREKITITVPAEALHKIKTHVPRGRYSDFFAMSALRELERRSKKELADLKGEIDFSLDWRDMEKLEEEERER